MYLCFDAFATVLGIYFMDMYLFFLGSNVTDCILNASTYYQCTNTMDDNDNDND